MTWGRNEKLSDAVSIGLVDGIIRICQTPAGKRDLNKVEKNETPLWKAVNGNYIEAVVALVTFGANINIPNNEHKTPMHLALRKKYIKMFKFCFGGYQVQLDMTDAFEYKEGFLQGHDTINKTLAECCCQQQKFVNGLRKSCVFHMAPGETFKENAIADIELNENKTFKHFFVTCLTDSPDKLYFHNRLLDNQQPLSDIYEFRLYCTTKVSCCITLKINDAPLLNEELSIICFAGNCYPNDGNSVLIIMDHKKVTEYKVHIDLESVGCVKFAVVKSVVTEIFTVSETQKSMTVQAIPGAKIDMSPEMVSAQVAVSATKTQKGNIEGDQKLICSDILHIEVSGTESKEEGIIQLPLHTNPAKNSDVCILVSKVYKPGKPSDWYMCKTGILLITDRKLQFHSSFDFKCCVAVVKQLFDQAKTQVIRAIKGEDDITIFSMLKQQENGYSLIVEFARLKSFEKRKAFWEGKKYKFESFKQKTVRRNKPYKISFSGKIVERGWKEDDSIITYLPTKVDKLFQEYYLLNCNVDGNRLGITGQVYISKPVFTSTFDIIDRFKAILNKCYRHLNFEDFTFLPIDRNEETLNDQNTDAMPIILPTNIKVPMTGIVTKSGMQCPLGTMSMQGMQKLITELFNAKTEGSCAPVQTSLGEHKLKIQ